MCFLRLRQDGKPPQTNDNAITTDSICEGDVTDIFVERIDDGTYRAIQNKRTVATGSTQAETANKAHTKRPDDPVLAERVRMTKSGSRDKWRRVR